MADDEGGEKSHEPTGKKEAEAKEEGKVPKSQDLFGVITLAVGVGLILVYKELIGGRVMAFTNLVYGEIPKNKYTQEEFFHLLYLSLITISEVILPLLITIWFAIYIAGHWET